MSENTIKVGDVVALKSGSDKMTVESIDDDTCHCCWIDPKSRSKRQDNFNMSALTTDLGESWGGGGFIEAM